MMCIWMYHNKRSHVRDLFFAIVTPQLTQLYLATASHTLLRHKHALKIKHSSAASSAVGPLRALSK
jgi:hypothetical protein